MLELRVLIMLHLYKLPNRFYLLQDA